MNVLSSVVGKENVGFLSDYVENLSPEDYETDFYKDFLCRHVVAKSEKSVPDVEETSISQTDLVNHVIGSLFKRAWPDEPNHMLTKGFRRLRPEMGRSHCGIRGISSYFPNPLVSECTKETWCKLLNRIGNARMLYLLMHCMIFRVDMTKRGEMTLTQISGSDFQNVIYETKRRKREKQTRRLCSIRRNRIFYSSTFNQSAGFPMKHVFNVLSKTVSDMETLNDAARQLVRRVFVNARSMSGKQNRRRPRRHRVTTPWRIRDTSFPLLKRLLQNHQHCQYEHILSRYCPVSSYVRRRRLVRSIRAQCSTGQGFLSQEEDEENEDDGGGGGGITTKEEKDDISKLLKCSTPHEHVFAFVTQVLSCLVPPRLWGSPKNKSVLLEKIQYFVSAGRDEDEITISSLMNRVSVNSFRWIQVSKNGNNPNEHSCRHDLAARWIQFLFADMVVRTHSLDS